MSKAGGNPALLKSLVCRGRQVIINKLGKMEVPLSPRSLSWDQGEFQAN